MKCNNCGAYLPEDGNTKCFVCDYDNALNNDVNYTTDDGTKTYYGSAPQNAQNYNEYENNQNYSSDNHAYNTNQNAQDYSESHNVHDFSAFENRQDYSSNRQVDSVQDNMQRQNASTNRPHTVVGGEGALRTKSTNSKTKSSGARSHTKASNSHVSQRELQGKRSKAVIILSCILAVTVILLVVASITTNVLYSSYNVDTLYVKLEEAFLAQDIETLKTIVVGDGVEVTDAGLLALCREFNTKEKVQSLVSSFNLSITNGQTDSDKYSSMAIKSSEVFLGYSDYKLQVKPVDLSIPVVTQNAVLTMDGVPMQGTYNGTAMQFNGIFPGVYTAVVTDQTLVGQSIQGTATDIALFDSNIPYEFSGALPISTVTVSNCVSDSALIYVNDVQIDQVPVGGVVTIPQVLVGSNLKIVVTMPSGATAASVVQYAQQDATQLAFTEYAITGGLPTTEQFDAIANTFFATYLAGINAKDPAQLQLVTEELRAFLTPELTAAPNDVVYSFTKVTADSARATQYFDANNVLTVSLNVATEYTSTPVNPETGEASGELQILTPYITLKIVFSADGAWLVNGITANSLENHTAGVAAG